ncbi:MAG: hypothetical protein AAF899_13565 [Pseudomonadota bacterium]
MTLERAVAHISDFPAPVRAAIPCPRGGQFVMSGFPGLETAISGEAYIDPNGLSETLEVLMGIDVPLLLVLPEEDELPEGAFACLRERAAKAGIALQFLPITDFSVPDEHFMHAWAQIGPDIHARLGAGGAVAACCQYGAGRSGLVAALLLIEQGHTASQAIQTVREHFHEAVESEQQETWLHAYRPLRSAAPLGVVG